MSQPNITRNKDVRSLVRWAAERGWTVEVTGKSHLCFRKNGCRPVYASGSPSDKRAMINVKKMMERFEKEDRR